VELEKKEAKIEKQEQELAARTAEQGGLDVPSNEEVGDDL